MLSINHIAAHYTMYIAYHTTTHTLIYLPLFLLIVIVCPQTSGVPFVTFLAPSINIFSIYLAVYTAWHLPPWYKYVRISWLFLFEDAL